MSISFGAGFTTRTYRWTNWKLVSNSKSLVGQFDDDGTIYTIYGYDGDHEVILCYIYKGTVPDGVISDGYSQSQNDTDKAEFEASYKPNFNTSTQKPTLDPRYIHRFGNMNLTASTEFTVAGRPYSEPASQAQRSVISTSANDASPGGSGARVVRLIYLDSNYNKHQEDISLLGTNGVNTVGTDVRFVEDFFVIQGSAAVGLVSLKTGLLGTGSDIIAIGAATSQAFLCHHYVPSGSTCYLMGWGVTVDRDSDLRLKTQRRSGSFLVDQVADLQKMYGFVTSGNVFGMQSFDRKLGGVRLDPQTYVRVTTQPSGTYSQTTRCYLDLWEEPTGSVV